MRTRLLLSVLAVTLPVLLATGGSRAASAPPTGNMVTENVASGNVATAATVVSGFHATLLDVMKRAAELGVKGRYDTLAPAVDKAFHLDLTARQSAGRRPWKAATESERKALLDAFREWTVGTYANQFDGWSGQAFVDHGQKPGPQNGTVLVETELTGKEPVSLTYLMILKDGRWGVYDVLVRQGTTSISQLAKHISEFKGIVKNGLPALTRTLTAKTQALLAE